MTALIISNEEMNYIMKIVKSLREASLFIKSMSKTTKNEAKEQKVGFLGKKQGFLVSSQAHQAPVYQGIY